jgi:hypothetical protein
MKIEAAFISCAGIPCSRQCALIATANRFPCSASRHRERIARECAARKDRVGARLRREQRHHVAPPRDGADRQSAADRLAVRRQIGNQPVVFLASAVRDPKARDHFVQDEEHAVSAACVGERVEEFAIVQPRIGALHRFDHHRGKLVAMPLD